MIFDTQEDADYDELVRKRRAEARAEAAIDDLEYPRFEDRESDVAADLWQRALDKRCER